MKASVLALAGSLLGSAMGAAHHGNHAAFHKRKMPLVTTGVAETCGCTTYVTTYYGEPTLVPGPAPTPTTTSSVESTSTITSTTAVHTSTVNIVKTVTLPTPSVTTCPTPGTYTFPAKTLTVTATTVVCAATTTVLAPGTQTYGGVTTTVTAPCTVTVPVAVVETTGADVTSTIRETVTLCPSAGKCVVAPTTTVVVVETTVVYPVPTTFVPGTYTQPATTVTVTATDFVYVCPYAPVGAPTPVPAPITPAEVAPVPVPAPVEPSHPVVSSPPVQATPEATKPGSTVGGGSGTISQKLNGRQWAMTYTPYQKNGLCKDATAVIEDIKLIRSKGFTTIRVYSTDCGALPSLAAAVKEVDIRLILGIFIDKRGLGFAEEQLAALSKWTRWDLVDLMVIGNESIFGGWISAEGLAAFIVKARSTLSAVGCKAKFTTTETLDTLQKPGVAGALCGVIDVVGANVQAFFTQSVSPSSAGTFVKGQLEIAKKLCGGAKEAYNLESGWPSYAWSANGNAVAGKEEQKAAILSILEVVGDKSVVFSYENDPWKDDGFQGVEKHFGCGWIF